MRLLAISTTTHDAAQSTSVAMLQAVLTAWTEMYAPEIKTINADNLHIVKNLSCYANGKKDCANPESGPYRCWAHYDSVKDPQKYGGIDQMPVIYDALNWADFVLWGTSVRWGSHTALMQRIIERMDTLENRAVSWGERNPLKGKVAGIVVGGLHWKTGSVADHLVQVFGLLGFTVPPGGRLAWQRSQDMNFEHPDPDKPYAERWLRSEIGQASVRSFIRTLVAARRSS